MADLTQAPPPISYPALYTFRVVGQHTAGLRERIRVIVQSVVGSLPDDALSERASSGGKYQAIHVSCLLLSEEQRREVYVKLKAEPTVVMSL